MMDFTDRQVFRHNLFLHAILVCSLVTFVFAILALVAGQSATSGVDAAILTIDTSGVAAALQRYLNSDVPISTIPDWYEVHFLSVCQGFWNTDVGTVCGSRPAGYRFSLANELTAITPAAAAPLFAWPAAWTLNTRPTVAFLITSIALSFISFLFYIGGLAKLRRIVPGLRLNVLRVAFFAGIVSAILFTNSAAQITSITSKLGGRAQPDFIKVPLNIWTDKIFYAFIWIGVGMAWVQVALAITLSLSLGGILLRWPRNKQLMNERGTELSEQD